MQIDLEQLLRAANLAGALSGTNGREKKLSLSTLTPLFGCAPLFGRDLTNPLLSLTIGDDNFLDWLGWRANNECNQFAQLITYVAAAGTSNDDPTSGVAGACAPANGVEYGACKVLLPDKGRIKRRGPVRDITEVARRGPREQPVVMKDGTVIEDELVWTLTLAGMALRQDLKRLLITGNAANDNEFHGLERLVNTGYTDVTTGHRCTAMDSIVLDWGNRTMAETVSDANFISWLIAVVRRIRQRVAWAGLGGIAVGEQIIMLPSYLRDELLNAFTCWSVCPGGQYNEMNMNTLEARAKRDSLNGGLFGDGQIFVDGAPIPVIAYDWQAIGQSGDKFTGDVYVLTRSIGNTPVLWGQHIDMNTAAAAFEAESGQGVYQPTDNGRFLTYWDRENECVTATVVMRPNIYLGAPWAQARITDVAAKPLLGPLSPDPASAYYAEEYLAPAGSSV